MGDDVSLTNGHMEFLCAGSKEHETLVDVDHPVIKEDIVRMAIQYLADNGYHASRMTLQDEANVKRHDTQEKQNELRRLCKAILDGDWHEVDKLATRPLGKNHKAFAYKIYKQQFLEHIEHHETQKAFAFLAKRLKPLEMFQETGDEFRDMCYLLTGRSVHDAASFKGWEGVGPGREKLVEGLQEMQRMEALENDVYVPPNRLVTLLRQAVAYQVRCSRYHAKIPPRVESLLRDYAPCIIPTSVRSVISGHERNVKCIEFVGKSGEHIASGSSDNTVRISRSEDGGHVAVLKGHTSRVWDVCSTREGDIVASASADGTTKLWDLKKMSQAASFGEGGDVYCCAFHPLDRHIVTGGYDKQVRLIDTCTGRTIKTFSGHQLAVTSVAFSPVGNMVATGSKDCSVRFWDVVSGLCVKTVTAHLGEVAAVQMDAAYMLSGSKDNANRLWDLRTMQMVRKYRGHQNTAKNFVRCSFAQHRLVVGGSEDRNGYIWDRDTGNIVQRLVGHVGIVFNVRWHPGKALFASCSDDCTVRTWHVSDF